MPPFRFLTFSSLEWRWPPRDIFPQLEIQDAGQQGQTNAISYYNDRVSEQATVSDPQSNPGGKNQDIFSERSPAEPVVQHFFSCGGTTR
jgi:hypothetical protein